MDEIIEQMQEYTEFQYKSGGIDINQYEVYMKLTNELRDYQY